jgi:beta-N-acetylhexosaminidase
MKPAPRLVVGFDGTTAPERLLKLIASGSVAGVVIFSRNLETTGQWLELQRTLRAAFRHHVPMIAVDQEGGLVQRLKPPKIPEVPALPPMGVLAPRLSSLQLQALGRGVGLQLAALGFNTNFAPVLDVHSRPENPIIGERAFGTTPDAVAMRALSYWRGLEDAGVRGCVKHFPGHGDTTVDSHIALPTVSRPVESLEAIEIAPFRAAIDAGVSLVMTAHVLYPALDPSHPATLSPAVIAGLLRHRLGFRGVVISDDLDMGAVPGRDDPRQLAAALDAAGVDLALVCRDLDLAEGLAAHLRCDGDTATRVHQLLNQLSEPRAVDEPAAIPRLDLEAFR